MRKLWVSGTGPGSFGGSGGGGSSGGGNGGFPGSSAAPNSLQSISLGLMHLRKLFGDYLHTPSDDKIYNMLPLFCKVSSYFHLLLNVISKRHKAIMFVKW